MRPRIPTRIAIAAAATIALAATSLAPDATAQAASIIWAADHETGDVSQWEDDLSGGVYNSRTPPGTSSIRVTTAASRSGRYGLDLTITGASGAKQGARIFRTWVQNNVVVEALPDRAYYSAWYLLPKNYETVEWWNVFQFKSRGTDDQNEPMLSFNIGNQADGDMELYVFHNGPDVSYAPTIDRPLPVGQWFHLEAWLEISSTSGGVVQPDGALRVWIDGERTINVSGIETLRHPDGRVNWSINNYTDDIVGGRATIYVDDASIAMRRQGRLIPACTVVGTPGDDVLRGTADDDVICGLGGDDTIYGRAGDDVIRGGAGADTIYAGAGADVVWGGAGADSVRGDGGADELHGEAGADRLFGGQGDDLMNGGLGADRFFGFSGDDVMIGGAGTDTFGRNSGDRVYPGPQ